MCRLAHRPLILKLFAVKNSIRKCIFRIKKLGEPYLFPKLWFEHILLRIQPPFLGKSSSGGFAEITDKLMFHRNKNEFENSLVLIKTNIKWVKTYMYLIGLAVKGHNSKRPKIDKFNFLNIKKNFLWKKCWYSCLQSNFAILTIFFKWK